MLNLQGQVLRKKFESDIYYVMLYVMLYNTYICIQDIEICHHYLKICSYVLESVPLSYVVDLMLVRLLCHRPN